MTQGRALCYVRRSIVVTGREISLDIQEQACIAKAKELDLSPKFFRDAKGHKGGRTTDRIEWQKLLTHIDKPATKAVIVFSPDRAFRNVKHLLEFIDRLKGVPFISTQEHIDTSTANGRMMLTMFGASHEWYANYVSEKVTGSTDALRRERGRFIGFPPFGTESRKLDNGDYRLFPSEKDQTNGTDLEALRQIYEHLAEGISYARTVRALNKAGWPFRARSGELRSFRYDDLRRLGYHWPIYAGYIRTGRAQDTHIEHEILDGSHDSILPAHLTEAVRIRLSINTKGWSYGKRQAVVHPLTGLLFCTYCKEPLAGYTCTYRDNWKRRHYRHRIKCEQIWRGYLIAEDIEQQVREKIKSIARSPHMKKAVEQAEQNAHEIILAEFSHTPGMERGRVEQALVRLRELYQWGDIDSGAYQRQRDKLNADLAALDNSNAPQVLSSGVVLSFISAMEEAKPHHLRSVVRSLWSRLECDEDGVTHFHAHEWSAPFA